MSAPTAGSSVQAEFPVGLRAGRRGVARLLGRLVVDEQELVVRSAVTRWIAARSISKDAVGGISLARRVELQLPILRWRQVEILTFDPGSTFADVSIKLPPRKHIIQVLRARGYTVHEQT